MDTIQDDEGRVLIHCKNQGCIYHGAGRLMVPGKTLEEALEHLKAGKGYVGGVGHCVEGEHQWELVAPDPN